jgi:hypothetical protein
MDAGFSVIVTVMSHVHVPKKKGYVKKKKVKINAGN